MSKSDQEEKSKMLPPKSEQQWIDFQSTTDGDVIYKDEKDDPQEIQPRDVHFDSRTMFNQKKKGHRHTRTLSDHFADATKLYEEDDDVLAQVCDKLDPPSMYPTQEARNAPATKGSQSYVGQKHRRVFSGGISNPNMAHRRLDSNGIVEFIDKQTSLEFSELSPVPPESMSKGNRNAHRRQGSAGLELLSAAARQSPPVMPVDPIVDQNQQYSGGHYPSHNTNNSSYPHHPFAPTEHNQNPSSMNPAQNMHTFAPYNPHSSFHKGSSWNSAYYPSSYSPSVPEQSHYPPPRGTYPVQYANPPPNVTRNVSVPPSHPLTSDRHHRMNYSLSSLGSSETKIETDEPLFSNGSNMPPPAMRSSSNSPHYRTSPNLFMNALRSSPTTFRSSPPLSTSSAPEVQVHPRETLRPPYHGGNVTPHSRLSSGDIDLKSIDSTFDDNLFQLSPSPKKTESKTVEFSTNGTYLHRNNENYNAELPMASTIVSQKFSPLTKSSTNKSRTSSPKDQNSSDEDKTSTSGRRVTGGVSKRVRRKCTTEGCTNRVVQGGKCIAHGAKRKLCGHPGCKKHVKKAGMCSTHGPARKRCEHENCTKVAVQGGKCIAHGAKKKICSVESCSKQAVLSGMCKRHNDESVAEARMKTNLCLPVHDPDPEVKNNNNENSGKSSRHRRGLSIFQDMHAVDTIIQGEAVALPECGESR